MTSHSVANLLGSLGVTKSLSRSHVSNDNPYSESQFKTMKYQPEFPDRFGSYQDALSHSRQFFGWYNNEHYHSVIGLLTPASLHYGLAGGIIAARTTTLDLAFATNPERFVNGVPRPAKLPIAAWINPPASSPPNEKRPPEIHCPGGPQEASLTHPRFGYPSIRLSLDSAIPRFGYPLAGCVPAAPASVSPNGLSLPPTNALNTRVMPEKIPGVRGLAPDTTPVAH